jgi:hypothetical protein
MSTFSQGALLVYSTLASTALVITFLAQARSRELTVLDEIQDHRIDIVEPDGTLRMVISNKARLPGVIVARSSRRIAVVAPSYRSGVSLLVAFVAVSALWHREAHGWP